MEHLKWQGWFSSKSVITNIKFSTFNDTLFLSTEKKIKLECEFLYSKYGKLSDSQFSAKKKLNRKEIQILIISISFKNQLSYKRLSLERLQIPALCCTFFLFKRTLEEC